VNDCSAALGAFSPFTDQSPTRSSNAFFSTLQVLRRCIQAISSAFAWLELCAHATLHDLPSVTSRTTIRIRRKHRKSLRNFHRVAGFLILCGWQPSLRSSTITALPFVSSHQRRTTTVPVLRRRPCLFRPKSPQIFLFLQHPAHITVSTHVPQHDDHRKSLPFTTPHSTSPCCHRVIARFRLAVCSPFA